MKPYLEDFYKQVGELHIQSKTNIQKSFEELKQYIARLDPIKLLSRLTLTFLFVPEDEFVGERHESIKWQRWIEFLAGYFITQPYPKNSEKNIDGRHIEKIEKLLDEYFHSVTTSLITSTSGKDRPNLSVESVIISTKLHSLYVRGDTYPQKLIELAEDLYSEHDDWFKSNLGFTIREAIELFKSITEECNKRTNEARTKIQEEAKKWVEELIKSGEAPEKDRNQIEARAFYYLYFGNTDKLLSFTSKELVDFSGLSKETCQKFLDRLSQPFRYKNPKFKDVFLNPFSAPWDYNTLYERPIIHYKDKHFIPVPPLLPTVLFYTFHYDLISDSNYESSYNSKRGKWLEKRTSNALEKLFPNNEVLPNPKYPNGKELADVLILHDRKIFIIQCKSKRLTYISKIGEDFKKLKDDIEKGIKDAFDQAVLARDYIDDDTFPRILTSNSSLVIDRKQVTDVFLVSVTLGYYQNLTTRLANINPALNLFRDKEYPWAISIFDLEVITELMDYPAQFIHYAKRRLQIEQTNFHLIADEIDLLGFYFSQGLCFETEVFKKPNWVCLSGFSEDAGIDRYLFEKYELGREVKKPKQKMPQGFEDYIVGIENLTSEYKTDCVMRLLNLEYHARELFVNTAEETKEKTRNDNELHSFSTVIQNYDIGFSFISMDAKGSIEELFRQTADFVIIKKHMTRCKEWVGLGWDVNSKKKIDVAVFASYDWFDDPVLDRISRETLKKGKIVNFNIRESG